MFKYRTYLISLFLLLYQQAYGGDNQIANQVSLSTSVNKEVNNDIFKATLSISKQTEASNLTFIYDQVNKSARKAFSMAKKYKDMDATTRSNTTQPIYKRNKIEGWRIIYKIELTTKQRNDLADLVGELQSFMKLDGMYFLVSDEKRKKTEDELITKAIADFNHRATIITQAQEKKLYSLVKMNINTGSQPRHNYSVAREQTYMSVKSAAPPPIEAGKQKITVSISGTIQLKE
jgi:predicted secreted protein